MANLTDFDRFFQHEKEDPRFAISFLTKKVEQAFDTINGNCGFSSYFDGEYMCSERDHILVLLTAIFEQAIFHRLSSASLAACIKYQGIPVIVFINPGGTMVTETNESGIISGKGFSRHPLTRILFWKAFLRCRPACLHVFNKFFRFQLNEDLLRFHFTTRKYECLDEIITAFNTNICVGCTKIPNCSWVDIRDIHGCSEFRDDSSCHHESKFNFHLLLLGALKNALKDKQSWSMEYLGVIYPIKFSTNIELQFMNCDYTNQYCNFFYWFITKMDLIKY